MTLRNIHIGNLIVVFILFGFYYQLAIINQSQAIVKDTLDVSLSSSNNTQSSIVSNNGNITQSFHVAYETLINDSHSLTKRYQSEIGEWQSKQYDNKAMILVTDKYLPEFQKLVDRAQDLKPTTAKYLQAKDLYIKSLQSEMGSYMHFRNFLVTGNNMEDNISTQLLTNALKYEINSFTVFNNKTVTDTENNNNNYGNETIPPACKNDQSPYTCI